MISTVASVLSSQTLTTLVNATQVFLLNTSASSSNYLQYTQQALLNLSDHGVADNFTNTSSFTPQFPSYIRYTSMVFCIVIMCLGVIGNIMVPIVILKSKDMRNSTNIFLMNLSVADLMVLLVCTPTVLVEVNSRPETWVLGEEMCKAVPFVELTVAHASVLTILAISFERYYAICEPLKAGYVCTKARASLICLLAWFFAAVFTSPILGVSEYQFTEYFDGTMVPVCWTTADSSWTVCFFITIIVMFFFLPLAILVILYTIIARTLMEHPSVIAPPKNNNIPCQTALKYRKQVVLMLGTVVSAFFICLLPFRALTLWILIAPAENVIALGFEGYNNLLYFSRIMFYLNSAINPILYNLMSSKFRDGFLKLCGVRRKRYKKRNRDHFGRKNTFNTTSTSNSITATHTTDSFWRRYSNRNTSQKSMSTVQNTPVKLQRNQTHDNDANELTNPIRNNNSKFNSYVRTSLHSRNALASSKTVNGESFV